MASYFDLPPQQNAAAASIEGVPEEERRQMGRMSILSPAVTQLLDDLGEAASDSESEEGSLSEREDTRDPGELTKATDAPKSRRDHGLTTIKSTKSPQSSKKEDRSPNKRPVHSSLSPARAEESGSSKPRLKPKQPHMARFHSLRSMLFSNTIEDKIKSITHEDPDKEEAAAEKWKSQHDHRQMPSRPKTPEKDAQGKPQGIGSRLKTSIRRMTTKDVPTMQTLQEDGAAHDFSDHGSIASSDGEPEPYQWKPREADEESIDHSDVEDLVRWVSRRDPPSDGETRASKTPAITLTGANDSHDSLGDSDVDELVQWASRKSSDPETKQSRRTGYSDASTESDSELINEDDSSEDEDADDLVRWVSHRDGPSAGPIRQTRNHSPAGRSISHGSDVPELGRWVTRHDGTSGESVSSSHPRKSLDAPKEPERGRPRSREGPAYPRPKPKGHITHEDIGDLVKWVSRKDSKQQSQSPTKVQEEEEEEEKLLREEEKKKQQLGMSVDEGSLSHGDVQEIIEHVRSSSLVKDKPEVGDLKGFRTGERGVKEDAASDHLAENRAGIRQIENGEGGKERGTRERNGSLGHEDVDELVKWISRKG
ncbi:hypothetical protein HBI88_236100 [Parastagonospora nodorum]|nr:hypothetical protein HBI75_186780 [Parastagonospora nodorum]KAH5172079.1 hypothetical protein HBH68_205050 [Parastagonospora nodorum]KAH5750250.1 hypothetical protein HBI97_240720 [Parastagonospora nodorum]KAH5786156.1 hypothetical protein HBI96_234510 [Parastagonospora nodorum]KAH5796996.1 hypothetical protein HBI94_237310 [Parastagonospora nodorum]